MIRATHKPIINVPGPVHRPLSTRVDNCNCLAVIFNLIIVIHTHTLTHALIHTLTFEGWLSADLSAFALEPSFMAWLCREPWSCEGSARRGVNQMQMCRAIVQWQSIVLSACLRLVFHRINYERSAGISALKPMSPESHSAFTSRNIPWLWHQFRRCPNF